MAERKEPRAGVPASFPTGSRYANFVLRIERPVDAEGRPVLDRGWDLLLEAKEGSDAYNHWADGWDEVLMYFADPTTVSGEPAWISPGIFMDAVFADESARAD